MESMIQIASTYEPPNPGSLSAYDSFRLWADHYRTYIIFVYLIAVYYMGFAPRFRMPVLKLALLYLLLFIGAILFAFLDTTLPVRGALFAAIVLLLIVRIRRNRADSPDVQADHKEAK